MISIFPLWTFHLYIGTFQQHLHMEYISLSGFSRACGSYQDFLDRGLLLTRKLLNQGFLLVKLMSSLRIFFGRHHYLVDVMEYLCHKWTRICSTCRNPSRFFPHSWLITGLVTRLTRRVPLVEQELLTLLEHRSSPSGINGVSLMCMFCWSLFVLLHYFVLPFCCLFVFDIRIRITRFVSSHSS
jgi:hypothetical protein